MQIYFLYFYFTKQGDKESKEFAKNSRVQQYEDKNFWHILLSDVEINSKLNNIMQFPELQDDRMREKDLTNQSSKLSFRSPKVLSLKQGKHSPTFSKRADDSKERCLELSRELEAIKILATIKSID